MNINLYQFSKRKNSTKQPGGSGTVVSGYLKEGANLRSPSLILKVSDVENFLKFNYMKMLGSFYYISDKKNISASEWQIDCVLDELATYKASVNNTDAFVNYSTSEFDPMINDSRTDVLAEYENIPPMHYLFPAYNAQYSYVLTVVNGAAEFPVVSYLMSESQLNTFSSLLWSENIFTRILESFNGKVMDAIISLRAYNVNIGSFAELSAVQDVVIGNINLSDYGMPFCRRINLQVRSPYYTERDMVWNYFDLSALAIEDFRNMYQRQYKLTVPFCGTYNLDPMIIQQNRYLIFQCGLDVVSGDVACNIYASDTLPDASGNVPYSAKVVERVSGKCGRDLPVAQSQVNLAGYAAGAAGAVSAARKSLAFGGAGVGPSAIVGGLVGGALAGTTNIVTNGGLGGSPASNMTFNNQFVLHILQQKSRFEPSDIAPTQGRPCMKVCHLGDLSGYVQTSGASVSAAAAGDIIQSINTSLDAGIYLE